MTTAKKLTGHCYVNLVRRETERWEVKGICKAKEALAKKPITEAQLAVFAMKVA